MSRPATSPRRPLRYLAVALLWSVAAVSGAQVTGFTDRGAFLAAIGGDQTAETLDYEDVAAGTTIPDGATVGPVTYGYSIAGGAIELAVTDEFETTSGDRSLGLDETEPEDRQFQHGDALNLSFDEPVFGVGVSIIVGDPLLAGDFSLAVAGGSASSSVTPGAVLADGSSVYFLGLQSASAFSSVDLVQPAPDTVAFLFNLDDLTLVLGDDDDDEDDEDVPVELSGFEID